jgi:hypothetical protein
MLPVPCAKAIGAIARSRTSNDAFVASDERRKFSPELNPLKNGRKINLLRIIAFPPD